MIESPTNWEALRNRLERDLATIIRHELVTAGASRVYCLLASECGLRYHDGTLGETTDRTCHIFRDVIGSRWAGPGPTFILNDVAIAEQRGGFFADMVPLAAGIACHELAHRLDGVLFLRENPFAHHPNAGADGYRFAAACAAPCLQPSPVSICGDHHPRFLRLMFHLRHRMTRLGWRIPASTLLSSACHLSHPGRYAAVLGDEPQQLEHLTLGAVAGLPLPAALVRLWESDAATTEGGFARQHEGKTTLKILERFRARFHSKAVSADRDYRDLVASVAGGKEPDYDRAASILTAAGKSPDDLAADVERFTRRLELSHRAASLHQVESDLEAINKAIAAETERYERLFDERDRAMNSLVSRKQDIVAKLQAARDAHARLVEDASDPALLAERQRMMDEGDKLGERSRWVARRIEELAALRSGARNHVELNRRHGYSDAAQASTIEQAKDFHEELVSLREEQKQLVEVDLPTADAAIRQFDESKMISAAA